MQQQPGGGVGHHSPHQNYQHHAPQPQQPTITTNQQQLQPFNASASANSAHSSPLRRVPPHQAVSPLASPMESRRIFMAAQHASHHHQTSGESPPHPVGSQMLTPPALGLSTVQLGYAVPACRLLVDPHTGQQFFVPATAPQPLAAAPAAAPAAYFQPFYSQPAAATAYYAAPSAAAAAAVHAPPHRLQQHQKPSSQHQTQQQHYHQQQNIRQQQQQRHSPPIHHRPNHHHPAVTATSAAHAGGFLFTVSQPINQLTSSGFYAQHHPIHPSSSSNPQYGGGPHRSQSPLGASPRDDLVEDSSVPYHVEMPPSTVGSTYGSRRRASDETIHDYGMEDAETEEEDLQQRKGSYGERGGYHHPPYQQQQQHFQRREHARQSTESRQSCSTRSSGGGIFVVGALDGQSDLEEASPRGGYSYSPPQFPLQKQHFQQQQPKSPTHRFFNQQQQQMSMSVAGGGGGSSSDSTSGFASAAGGAGIRIEEQQQQRQPPSSPLLHQQQQHFSSSPFYQQQQQQQRVFSETTHSFTSPPFRGGSGGTGREQQQQQQQRHSPPQHSSSHNQQQQQKRMKAIRMDIDLSSSGGGVVGNAGSGASPRGAENFGGRGGGGIPRTGRQSSFGSGGDKQPQIIATTTAGDSSLSVRATVLRTAPPTAFTISFNDEHAQLGGQVSISEVSLQEAARQAPKGRRLMMETRKPSNITPQKSSSSLSPRQQQQTQQDSGSECGGDPKRWLFRKMMMGRRSEAAAAAATGRRGGRQRSGSSSLSEATTATPGHPDGGDDGEQQEDIASEAGTYVVGGNGSKTGGSASVASATATAIMTTSQISGVSKGSSKRTTTRQYYDDSSDSSSTVSTRTSSGERTPSPSSPKANTAAAPVGRSNNNNHNLVVGGGPLGKRSLMNDLRQLREGGQIDKSTTNRNTRLSSPPANAANIAARKSPPQKVAPKIPPPVPAHRGPVAAVATSGNLKKSPRAAVSTPQIPFSRPCRCPTQHQQQQQQQQLNQAFNRNDGGRFSMRPTSAQRVAGLPSSVQVPSRQTSKSVVAKLAKQKEEEKMMFWLRRKGYDPRRSAAAAEQQQQFKDQPQQQQNTKSQQDAFTATRSMSAATTTPQSPFARWRNAAHHHQQKHSTAVQNDAAPRSSHRSHDDLSRLGESLDDEESFPSGGMDSCTDSGLQKTVDELTQKCHKSIALLKLCNQSSLSPSVEQLLERVAQSGVDSGILAPEAATAAVASGAATTGGSTENISDRLEQLSSAFDAIQKYLEEQTTSTTTGGNGASPHRTFSGTFVVRRSRSGGLSTVFADEPSPKTPFNESIAAPAVVTSSSTASTLASPRGGEAKK